MKRVLLVVVLLSMIMWGNQLLAGEYPKAYYSEKQRIVLENELLRFEIDPKGAGRVSSFIDKRDGVERIVPGRVEGLCFDQFYEQDWATLSGSYYATIQPYEGEIMQSGGEKAIVRVGRSSIAYESGVYNENHDNLYVERIFTIDASNPVLDVKIRIYNRSEEGRRPAYWIRNGYTLGGDREHERYIRPSRRGIMDGGPDDPSTDQMVWDPSYGWTATIDTVAHTGVAWLIDVSKLMFFYNSIAALTGRHIDEYPNKYGVDPLWIWDNAGSTTVGAEWYYHKAFIPAGSFWETSVQMISMSQVNYIDHASKYFIADVMIPQTAGKDKISICLTQSSIPVKDIKISGEVIDLDSQGKSISLGIGQTDRLTPNPRTITFSNIIPIPRHAAYRFHVEGVTSDEGEITDFFECIDNPDRKTLNYQLPAPELTLHYKAGDNALRIEDNTLNILYLQGLAFERWGLMKTLKEMKAEVRESEFMKRRITTAVRYFPVTLHEALKYDLIILAAIDAHAIGFEGCQILRDYVRNGGSLFILGGIYGWGGGRFHEYGLDEFLPLSIESVFDLEKGNQLNIVVNENQVHKIVKEESAAVRGDIDWGVVYWFHKLRAKPEAKVLIRLGDLPLLAVSALGHGKIACMAGTTLGTDDAKLRPFWKQSGWENAKRIVLNWLIE